MMKDLEVDAQDIFKFKVVSSKACLSDPKIGPMIHEVIRDRYKNKAKADFEFNSTVKAVIKEIHNNWVVHKDLTLPEFSDSEMTLEDLGLTNESMASMELQDMEDTFSTIIMADAPLFVKLLYSQGYDLWLTKTRHPSKPSDKHMLVIRNINYLEKLKKLVE